MSEYVSIPCIEHERLEFAVLRRQRLQMRIVGDTGEIRDLTVLPTDVATRDQAEWLSYQDAAGVAGVVRLDRIQSFRPAQ
jgi:Rho-binding antiterminator